MFDSFYDEAGHEWQTKAFDRNLDVYRIGDAIPADCPATYQVEILGGARDEDVYSLATVRNGVLASINDERDRALPLLNYSGHLIEMKGIRPWT